MIAGCIDHIRRDDCGDCARREACSKLFGHLFQSSPDRGERRSEFAATPLGALLGRAARFVGDLAKESDSFRRKVERRIKAALEDGEISAERIASDLGCSRHTLHRRLKAEGVSFATVLEDFRRRRAIRLLGERMSVKEVAYRLGYSDAAAFSRAFKRWTGTSPREARKKGPPRSGSLPT